MMLERNVEKGVERYAEEGQEMVQGRRVVPRAKVKQRQGRTDHPARRACLIKFFRDPPDVSEFHRMDQSTDTLSESEIK